MWHDMVRISFDFGKKRRNYFFMEIRMASESIGKNIYIWKKSEQKGMHSSFQYPVHLKVNSEQRSIYRCKYWLLDCCCYDKFQFLMLVTGKYRHAGDSNSYEHFIAPLAIWIIYITLNVLVLNETVPFCSEIRAIVGVFMHSISIYYFYVLVHLKGGSITFNCHLWSNTLASFVHVF